MRNIYSVFCCSIFLAACASTGSGSVSSQLPPGGYTLKGFNSDGKQTGGTVKIDVPFNDPSFAVGVLCSNPGTVSVKATNKAGADTTLRCVINGKTAS